MDTQKSQDTSAALDSPLWIAVGERTPEEVESCCRISYGHPLATWLMGNSFHPGGLRLTAKLARLLAIDSDSHVFDAGSGTGATAVHLAQTLRCRVTGLTLEEEGVNTGDALAKVRGVSDRVRFTQGSLREVDFPAESFDFVVMECVLSILADKAETLRRLHDMLKPGGALGLTDVTVAGALPPALSSAIGNLGCVGGALSMADYRDLLTQVGFVVEQTQDCHEEAESFVGNIAEKLLIIQMAAKMGKLPLPEGALGEASSLVTSAQELVRSGVLGYGLLVARKA